MLDHVVDVGMVPEHFSRVMQALTGIQERPGWTLELSFRPEDIRHGGLGFKLGSSEWLECRGRVHKVTLCHTFADYYHKGFLDITWVTSLLHECAALEALTLDREPIMGYLCRHPHLPKLRHLVIRRGRLPGKAFPQFLVRHADTLETITCDDTSLHNYFDLWSVQTQAEIDSDVQSWFTVFEIMRSMPRLMEVRLYSLRQSYDFEGKLLDEPQSSIGAPHVFRTNSMLANKPDVVTKLGLAIEQSVLTTIYEPGLKYLDFEVSFVRKVEISDLPTSNPIKEGRKGYCRATGGTLFIGDETCMLQVARSELLRRVMPSDIFRDKSGDETALRKGGSFLRGRCEGL